MKTTPISILDACCGGRMFYFEKDHPNILYVDRRRETVEMKDRDKIRTLEINPDFVMDFTDMKFPDECFYFVVFDPPHLINCGKNSWLAKKYGKLDKDTWRETLSKGLSECYLRVYSIRWLMCVAGQCRLAEKPACLHQFCQTQLASLA